MYFSVSKKDIFIFPTMFRNFKRRPDLLVLDNRRRPLKRVD